MSTANARTSHPRTIRNGEPAWEIARLFPNQGDWSEEEYLALPDNRRIEFTDGRIEVLPVPTEFHQDILIAFFDALRAFVRPRQLGKVLLSGMKVRLRKGKYREPDVLFMLAKHAARRTNEYWEGADLVMEVVSDDPGSRKRDFEKKRRDYAEGRVPDYWIIDPKEATITVLRLRARKYVVHGKFSRGQRATSALLSGFEVEVDEILAAS
jgi:Uma2 family endonuclease